MSPHAQALFLDRVYPTIQGTVPRAVTPIGTEDRAELIQDTAVSACQGIESLEARGRDIQPSSVVYYAIQRAKSGRRSQSASRRDVLAPGTHLDGAVSMLYLDQPVDSELEEPITLHDAVADYADDPATIAARHLDWAQFWAGLSEREQYVLRGTAIGERVIDQAAALGISAPAIVQIKRRIATKALTFWGDDLLLELSRRPLWRRTRVAA